MTFRRLHVIIVKWINYNNRKTFIDLESEKVNWHESIQVKSFVQMESVCVFSFGPLFLIHSIIVNGKALEFHFSYVSTGAKKWGNFQIYLVIILQ